MDDLRLKAYQYVEENRGKISDIIVFEDAYNQGFMEASSITEKNLLKMIRSLEEIEYIASARFKESNNTLNNMSKKPELARGLITAISNFNKNFFTKGESDEEKSDN